MRISVVTISFNQAAYLRRAMDSVVEQSWPDKEFIVVDAGSQDGSREIIESYGTRVNHRIFERDRGAADGLNKGFARATGDILCFLNSDDEFLPDAFERMAHEFAARPKSDFLTGCGYIIDAQGRRIRRVVPTVLTVDDYIYGCSTVFQQATFFRRRCWDRVGGFNVENRTCWDGELFFEFVRGGMRHGLVYEDFANFRIYDGSITGSGRLHEIYLRDSDVIFSRAKGRPRKSTDRLMATYMRTTKLIRNPRYAVERLRAAFA